MSLITSNKYSVMQLNEKIMNCLGIYNKLQFEELHDLLFKIRQ